MRVVVRPLLWGLSAVALIILIGLGTWQVQRLQWKTELIATVEARIDAAPVPLAEALARYRAGENVSYLPVAASGGFPSARTAHVFGTYDGAAGYYAFQAFRLDDGTDRLLLVNRGFVPQDQKLEYYPLPDAQRLTGLARVYEGPGGLAAVFAPENRPEDGVFFNRDHDVLTGWLGQDLAGRFLPIAIDSTLPTELPRGGTTRVTFRNAHLGYAITWYGLAAGLVAVVAGLSLRRG